MVNIKINQENHNNEAKQLLKGSTKNSFIYCILKKKIVDVLQVCVYRMIECCSNVSKVKKNVQSALTDQTMLKTVNANSLLKQKW